MKRLDQLLDRLWDDYQALNPDARRIHELLEKRGEKIQNDHIAFRTFNHPRVNIEAMAQVFVENGYQEGGRYDFPEKKLNARHYEPPEPKLPKIFISELRIEELPKLMQVDVVGYLGQVPEDLHDQADFCVSGRSWAISYQDYEALRTESEYAAWVAAFGFRANHFTIDVNALTTFNDIRELVDFLKAEGFEMNTGGGEIKGSKDDFLEQASTLAPKTKVEFSDGVYEVPSCYYEFAQRYKTPEGKLFQGFIAQSADKIFESTDAR